MHFKNLFQSFHSLSLGLAGGAALFSIWLQNHHTLPPCPLCLMSRYLLIISGLIYFTRLFFVKLNVYFKFIVYFSLFVIHISGLVISIRQLYLAYQPPALISCQAYITQLTDQTLFKTFFRALFAESGTCYAPPQFLYLSLSTWTLIVFSLLLLNTAFSLIRENKNP